MSREPGSDTQFDEQALQRERERLAAELALARAEDVLTGKQPVTNDEEGKDAHR